MDAIDPDKRARHIANSRSLFNGVTEIRELENGYAFCLNREFEVLAQVAEFITLEKLCCPFFGFIVEVAPEGGSIWLKLIGGEGVKPFIQAELGELMGKPMPW
jgi:hypothetical protein